MIQLNKDSLTNAANFILKWGAVTVVAYFVWNKFAPWLDSFVPF